MPSLQTVRAAGRSVIWDVAHSPSRRTGAHGDRCRRCSNPNSPRLTGSPEGLSGTSGWSECSTMNEMKTSELNRSTPTGSGSHGSPCVPGLVRCRPKPPRRRNVLRAPSNERTRCELSAYFARKIRKITDSQHQPGGLDSRREPSLRSHRMPPAKARVGDIGR